MHNTSAIQTVPRQRHYGVCDFEYDREWWLVYVLQVNESEVQETTGHPSGLSRSFTYPSEWISVSRVLTKVDPRTVTDCTCVIS